VPKQGFRVSAESVSGRATHVIVSDGGYVDESLVASLRIDHDLAAVAPVVGGGSLRLGPYLVERSEY